MGFLATVEKALDKTIDATAPGWGLKRHEARAKTAAYRAAQEIMSEQEAAIRNRKAERREMMGRSGYRGADADRTDQSRWDLVSGNSADEDLFNDLDTLRERSRELNRNDPFPAGLTNLAAQSTVGMGLKPQSRIDRRFAKKMGLSDDQVADIQAEIDDIFAEWLPQADATGRCNFYDLQNLQVMKVLEDGELFWGLPMLPKTRGRTISLACEAIEADRVDTPISRNLKNPERIRRGIELDAAGLMPIAAYVSVAHPGDHRFSMTPGDRTFRRVEFRAQDGQHRLLHTYWQKRPGQSRGVPWFAPVIQQFADLNDYLEAEIVGARVAACITAFIKKNDPVAAINAVARGVNAKGERLQDLNPGQVWYGQPNEDVSVINPSRPSSNFGPFVERALKAICFGLGIPYQVMDFSSTNYSSIRAALVQADLYFRWIRSHLVHHFCQPVFELLIREAWASGRLPIDYMANPRKWSAARWLPLSGRGWVDPMKEVQAAVAAINAGISTRTDEAAHLGKDWDEVLAQLARERDEMEEMGIVIGAPEEGDGDFGEEDDEGNDDE